MAQRIPTVTAAIAVRLDEKALGVKTQFTPFLRSFTVTVLIDAYYT